MFMRRPLAAVAVAIIAVFVTGCTSTQGDGQKSESKAQQSNYDRLVAAAPAHQMTYPITRNTINKWIDTWNKPGAISYNYIGTVDQNGAFKTAGYYVLKGLPVSYCTSLTPTYKLLDVDGDGMGPNTPVAAPGLDGVYYSGGDCNRYYGFDAVTGQYVEYNVPMNVMVRTTDQPLNNVQGAVPLGPSSVADVKANK